MKLYETNDTKVLLESAFPSSFVFTVVAINVLGAGEESNITSEFCAASVLFLSVYKIIVNKVDSDLPC